MVHLMTVQLLIVRRYYMANIEPYDDTIDIDMTIQLAFKQLKQEWATSGKSLNELCIIMNRFCKKYNYLNLDAY